MRLTRQSSGSRVRETDFNESTERNSMSFRLAAVIPCYNVGAVCLDTIHRTLDVTDTVIAVNDGSTDNTEEVLSSTGATILTHSHNRGKGAALRTGFEYLLTLEDWDAVVTLDADGQHDPSFIPKLAEPIHAQTADLVVGSRQFNRAEMPLRRWLANILSSFLISRCFRIPITDIQSGFRVFSRALLCSLISKVHATGFEIETEMAILAIREKARMIDCPIPSLYNDSSNRLSHWKGFHDSLRIARTVLKYWRNP